MQKTQYLTQNNNHIILKMTFYYNNQFRFAIRVKLSKVSFRIFQISKIGNITLRWDVIPLLIRCIIEVHTA